MPKPRDNRLRLFPDRRAAAQAAGERRSARFPRVVPDTVAGGIHAVRRDTCRGRAVFSTCLCEDGRFRCLDRCDHRLRLPPGRPAPATSARTPAEERNHGRTP